VGKVDEERERPQVRSQPEPPRVRCEEDHGGWPWLERLYVPSGCAPRSPRRAVVARAAVARMPVLRRSRPGRPSTVTQRPIRAYFTSDDDENGRSVAVRDRSSIRMRRRRASCREDQVRVLLHRHPDDSVARQIQADLLKDDTKWSDQKQTLELKLEQTGSKRTSPERKRDPGTRAADPGGPGHYLPAGDATLYDGWVLFRNMPN